MIEPSNFSKPEGTVWRVSCNLRDGTTSQNEETEQEKKSTHSAGIFRVTQARLNFRLQRCHFLNVYQSAVRHRLS